MTFVLYALSAFIGYFMAKLLQRQYKATKEAWADAKRRGDEYYHDEFRRVLFENLHLRKRIKDLEAPTTKPAPQPPTPPADRHLREGDMPKVQQQCGRVQDNINRQMVVLLRGLAAALDRNHPIHPDSPYHYKIKDILKTQNS